jgi:hypothetical protein
MQVAQLLTDRLELVCPEIDVAIGGAPTFASLAIQNGTNGKFTVTSLKGQGIGNSTTVTLTMSTNAASVSLTGQDITVDLHKDGTNAFSDTTASNVKTLLEANTNITALVSVATNTAGIMATAAKASLAGGDDKLTSSSKSVASFIHDGKGVFTLTLTDPLKDFAFGALQVDATAALSNVAKVECVKVDSDTFTIRLADYAGSLVDPSAAGKLAGVLVGQNMGAR